MPLSELFSTNSLGQSLCRYNEMWLGKKNTFPALSVSLFLSLSHATQPADRQTDRALLTWSWCTHSSFAGGKPGRSDTGNSFSLSSPGWKRKKNMELPAAKTSSLLLLLVLTALLIWPTKGSKYIFKRISPENRSFRCPNQITPKVHDVFPIKSYIVYNADICLWKDTKVIFNEPKTYQRPKGRYVRTVKARFNEKSRFKVQRFSEVTDTEITDFRE